MSKAEIYKIFCFVLLVLVLIAGFVAFYIRDAKLPDRLSAPVKEKNVVVFDPVPAEPLNLTSVAESTVPVEVVVEPTSKLQAILNMHSRATGYSAIQSIRVSGTYTSRDAEMKIISLAKKPHFYRQTVDYQNSVMVAGFDGEQFWQTQSQQFFDVSDESLMALNYALFILDSAMPYLIWESEKGVLARSVFKLMEDEVWNGRRCIVIKNTGLLENPVYHYIDPSTGLELCRRALIGSASADPIEVELRYLPPHPQSAYSLPSGAEVYVDGELYGVTEIDKIEVNQGLPSFLFHAR